MKFNLALRPSTQDGAEGICIPMISGLITGIAANADLAAVCNLDDRPLCVRLSRLRFVPDTAFAAAQALAFRVNKVYGFTAVHTGGTPTAVQAHHYHQGGIMGSAAGDRIALTSISSVIAATAAITTATYTAEDTDEPEQVAVASGSTLPALFDDYVPVGGLPWVLPKNTGLVLNNVRAFGASGTGNLYWSIDAYRLG
jgi:hypothetical protein